MVAPVLSSSSLGNVDAALPEAPTPQLGLQPKPKPGTNPSEHIASKTTMVIPSDWHAQHLTKMEAARAGLEDLYTFQTVAGWFLAAGYEQGTNGAPNYGTDKGAFGERLGAAALRGTSQNVLAEVILAPVLHEDARYYVEGPKYNPVHRTLYAVSRTFITKNLDGGNTINGAVLIGYAGAAALTPTYYPQVNHTFRDVVTAYGGGIGGTALGFFVSEFSGDVLQALHLTHR